MLFNPNTGGLPVNFRVVGGLTQPTSPKENTIWVTTDVDITSWAFSATEPGNPMEGMVWFSVGKVSLVEFNALRKNELQTYPTGAKQRIEDQWEARAAKTYQDGQWKTWWDGYLYNDGNTYDGIGGEWIAEELPISDSSTSYKKAPAVAYGGDYMLIDQTSGNGGGTVRKEEKLDLSGFKTLSFQGTATGSSVADNWRGLYVWSAMGPYATSNVAAAKQFGAKIGDVSCSLDISQLKGEYYVGFAIYQGTISVEALKLVE